MIGQVSYTYVCERLDLDGYEVTAGVLIADDINHVDARGLLDRSWYGLRNFSPKLSNNAEGLPRAQTLRALMCFIMHHRNPYIRHCQIIRMQRRLQLFCAIQKNLGMLPTAYRS